MAKLEWTPNILLGLYNKSFFTLLSITLKWESLWIKPFCRLYLNEIAFNLIPQQSFCTKAIYIRKSRKTNMILKCLCPDVGCVAP